MVDLRITCCLLRRHVGGRPERDTYRGHAGASCRIGERLRHAKIGDERVVFAEQDVVRFDVAVHDAVLVCVRQCFGNVAQCAPTRSSSSHATYEVILQRDGDAKGWEWLKRLAANTGIFTARSRDVPSVVARGEFAAGFAVPSYMAFEDRLSGHDIRFVAPKTAWITPEPMGILAGSKRPRAARAFVEYVLWSGDHKLNTLLTSQNAFVSGPLAQLYGVTAPAGGGAVPQMVTLPAAQGRSGLLTQAGFLSVQAHPDQTSPVLRGKFVLSRLLCTPPPPPPPDVNVTPPDTSKAATARERLAAHEAAGASCAS